MQRPSDLPKTYATPPLGYRMEIPCNLILRLARVKCAWFSPLNPLFLLVNMRKGPTLKPA